MEEGNDDRVVIFIDSRNGYRAKLAIKPNDKLDLLFKKYCTKLNLPVGTMRFVMDGRRVEGKKTAGQLRTEVDESEGPDQEIVIQAMDPLQGGGPGENEASGKRKAREISGGSIRAVSTVDAGNSNVGVWAQKKLKTMPEMVEDVDAESKPKFVWLTFVMPKPNCEKVRIEMSTQITMSSACRAFCKQRNLDFETTRFSIEEQRVIWRMIVEKVWMNHKEDGKTEIFIDVRTGCLPYVHPVKEEKHEPVAENKKNYSSDKVPFILKQVNSVTVKIRASQNETMGFVFRKYSQRMNGIFRFLRDGKRMSELQLVGEIKEEFESEDGQEGNDIIIEVVQEQFGGHPLD